MKPNFADKTKPNRLYFGDCLDVMREDIPDESVDLIYLDPPFNSNRTYEAPVGSQAAGAAFKDAWTLKNLDVAWMGLIADEQPAVANLLHTACLTHGKGMQSYLTMMAVRLLEMRRVLKETGSIYLHCDDTASRYLKLLMDAVFEASNFRNMLVWNRTRGKGLNPTRYVRNCDHMLFYGNSQRPIWNQQYEPYEEGYGDNWRQDALGTWESSGLSGGRAGGPEVYEPFNGVPPPSGRAWAPPTRTKFPPEAQAKLPDDYETLNQLQKCEALDVAGLIHWPKNGRPRCKKYLSTLKGRYVSDLIGDIPLSKHMPKSASATRRRSPWPFWIASSGRPPTRATWCWTPSADAPRHASPPTSWGAPASIDISPKAVELVNMRLQKTMGSLFHHGYVTARTDIPRRTDIEAPIPYRQNKHVLFGQQEGLCNGCRTMFPFRNFTIDHVVPQSRGGTDHLDNLQLTQGQPRPSLSHSPPTGDSYMTRKPDEGIDPAKYVDAFTELVEGRDWHGDYVKAAGWYLPYGPPRSPTLQETDYNVEELKKALKAQNAINIELLADIDQLKKRLDTLERRR